MFFWQMLSSMALLLVSSSAFASSWSPTLLVNTESSQVIDDLDGVSDVRLQFGDTLNKQLTFSRSNARFEFTDSVYVDGNITASGSVAINADQLGSATLTFGNALQDQVLQFTESGNAFNFSTAVVVQGGITASAATLTNLTNCNAISTNGSGSLVCVGGSGATFISVTSNADSIASDALYDVFEAANYSAPDFITNAAQNSTFNPVDGTFTTEVNGTFLIIASVVTTVSNDNNISYSILKNGVPVYQSERQTDNATDPHESTVQTIVQADAGDTFELTIDGITNGRNITINGGTTLSIANILTGGSGGGGLAPYIEDASSRVDPSGSSTVTITGGNFDADTAVVIPGWEGTINAIRVLSDAIIEVDVTAGATQTVYDVVLANGSKDSTTFFVNNGSGAITVAVSAWQDLRLGGDSFTDGNASGNDIRYRSGMALVRDANGMYFTGLNPWSSWVKFESLGWARGTDQTLEWIFTNPTAAMMIGIGSDATNETSTAQFREAEVEAYFQNSTILYGLYGNNGTPGTDGNQANGSAITAAGVFKVKFEDDGDVGDTFTLYEIPSANPSDWDDESTVINTFTIGGTLNPNEANIMPFIIPNNGGAQRFIAVKVE